MEVVYYTFLVVAVLALVATVVIYNQLNTRRNRWKNSLSQIEVQLQRRYELIPNLVETAKGYMQHEASTLSAVIEARNTASDCIKAVSTAQGGGGSLPALAGAEASLGRAMGKFNLLVEDYPELKADEQMRELNEELKSTENRVAFARQAYSDTVMDYNTYRQSFPAILISRLLGFHDADLFELEVEEARRPVKVTFA